MTDVQAVASSCLALWNEPDPERRRALVTAGWTADARSIDPLAEARGRERIAAMIEGVRTQFPDHRLAVRGKPDGHGPLVRLSRSLVPAEGVPVAGGTDAEGRLAEVVVFLDGMDGSASHG